jgi:hypothetical protein
MYRATIMGARAADCLRFNNFRLKPLTVEILAWRQRCSNRVRSSVSKTMMITREY